MNIYSIFSTILKTKIIFFIPWLIIPCWSKVLQYALSSIIPLFIDTRNSKFSGLPVYVFHSQLQTQSQRNFNFIPTPSSLSLSLIYVRMSLNYISSQLHTFIIFSPLRPIAPDPCLLHKIILFFLSFLNQKWR